MTELLAALHRAGRVDRVAVDGLTDLEVLALLEQVAGHEMDADGLALRDALVEETAGNPFFVAEMLRHLDESGAVARRDGRWGAADDLRAVGLPVSVREVVGRRLALLGGDAERLLASAAVIGRDFDIPLLASVADIDEDTVIDVCDAAVAASILHTTDVVDRYTFAHALIEHSLYESLSPTRRARAHGRVATALETLPDAGATRAGELAHHWGEAATPTDAGPAVRYARIAGDRALEQLAPDDAVRWFARALDLLEAAPDRDPREHIEIVVGLGTAQHQTGDPAAHETLVEAARLADRHDLPDLLARAVLADNRGFHSSIGVPDTGRIDAVARALARLDPGPSGARSRLLALASVQRVYSSPLAERVALAEESIAVARASGDRAALVRALHLPNAGMTHPSTLAMRVGWLAEAIELVEHLDDPAERYWVLITASSVDTERADGAALDAHMSEATAMADRVPDSTIQWHHIHHAAWVAGLRGDLTAYEDLAERALAYGSEHGQASALPLYGAQLSNVRARQGRLAEMVPLLEQAIVDSPAIPAYRAVLAVASAHAGDRDRAAALVADAAAEGFPMPEDQAWSIGICSWVAAACATGSVDAAPTLRALFLPYHDQICSARSLFQASVAHYLGLLDHLVGDHDSAEAWFAQALDLHERVRSPPLVAQTRAEWAALLADRRRGDDEHRARVLAEDALAAASAGGYGDVEVTAREVLARLP